MIPQIIFRKSANSLRRSLAAGSSYRIHSRGIASSSQNMNEEESSSYVREAAVAFLVATAGGYVLFDKSQPATCEEEIKQKSSSRNILGNSLSALSSGKLLDSAIKVRTNAGMSRKLPIFSSKEVAKNNGENGKPIWVTYGGNVYDITDFVNNHPGGSEKILQAAGSVSLLSKSFLFFTATRGVFSNRFFFILYGLKQQYVEPYWHVYRQHFATDLPSRLMEKMIIGELLEEDQGRIDEKMETLYETAVDPYANEPTTRHKALIVHSEQPMNAEVPEHLLTKNYLTPPDLFYIRHHHPVPYLNVDKTANFKLEIDLGVAGKGTSKISLEDIKKMPKVEVTATLQCSGNRRGGYNNFSRTSGTSWGQGAISTAKWGGVRLADLIKYAGLEDEIEAQEKDGIQHVRFHAIDGMMASIGIEKAMNRYGDVIICYEMNGKPLPRDHGYPLRVIVPGYAAVRNVKWVNKIELSKEEAEGPWQRGLNYKVLPPGVTDANKVDLKQIPSMTELSVQSGITSVEPQTTRSTSKPGQTVMVKASGWAYSGGGRNIVRVDVTGDGARSWQTATLQKGSDQRQGRAWAWTFWEAVVPATVQEDGSVQVYSKAVDLAFNSQPDSAKHNWNVRGLTNNSWYGKKVDAQ
jgi:sulfite oxidase